jgi:glycosyltransferase involved in cell wall biosynthesis
VADGPRVAIDVTALAGQPTGIAQSVRGLIGGLPADISLLPYVISTRARRARDQLPPGTRVVPGARALITAWQHADQPTLDLLVRGAHVVHATNYLAPPTSAPTLVTLHDCSLVRHPSLCTPRVRALVPIVRRALRRGAHVHTPSEFVAREVREIFGRELRDDSMVRVVPWGIPELAAPLRAPGVVPSAPFVLAIGTLEPRKNLPHLVAAFGVLARSRPDVLLVLAGPDGPARPDIDSALARLPSAVAARVRITGAVSEPVRAALITDATAVAYPSVYEGFGFPILEAMRAGTPVVAARAGAIPEIAGDAALLVEPTDEAGIAQALDRVIGDVGLRQDLIARGATRAAGFSWDACGAAIARIYREIARRA